MSTHSLFAPSASARWINCPGSMAFPENHVGSSSTFADDGTASHEWSADCLRNGGDAEKFISAVIGLNGKTYTMDDERAGYVQVYLDDVRRRAIGGHLLVEQRVDLSDLLGEGQGGTADAAIYLPRQKTVIIEDLKYGMGEKVFASYPLPGTDKREINYQLGLYGWGLVRDFGLLGEVEKLVVVICQPRLNHIDEFEISIEDLEAFAEKAKFATVHAGKAMTLAPNSAELEGYLLAGEKQCRWCRAVTCVAREKRIAAEVRADFETIAIETPRVPIDDNRLQRAYSVLPFIEDWIKAVRAEVLNKVMAGEFLGEDGKPMKFVEGKPGKRVWLDEAAAGAALISRLGDKAYEPQKLITAPAAGKLLDKKATKKVWEDEFVPLIKKAPGKPVLALGSDPRPAFIAAAGANEFDELGADVASTHDFN